MTDYSESPEIEVLSCFVLHSCVAEVGLCGEIGFAAFAFIVCENLHRAECMFPAHLLICIRFADEIMFFFLPVTNYRRIPNPSIQCDTSHLFLGSVFVCSDLSELRTYSRNITVIFSKV